MPSKENSGKSEFEDSEVFDIQRVRQLVELMKEHDLSEIDLRHSSKRIRMRRGDNAKFVNFPAMPTIMAPGEAPTAASTSAAPAAEDSATYINSPMVGTFYSKPKPDEPSFIKVGDHVEIDTVVCLVEAMKMFNEIPAGMAGKIVEVMVKNEEPVDVNKPLFRIEPA